VVTNHFPRIWYFGFAGVFGVAKINALFGVPQSDLRVNSRVIHRTESASTKGKGLKE
jgi:hypothetical protein